MPLSRIGRPANDAHSSASSNIVYELNIQRQQVCASSNVSVYYDQFFGVEPCFAISSIATKMPISLVNDEAGNPLDNGSRTRAPPKYSITRGEDDVLQWQPPIGSRELANALSYHYPLEQSLQEKMQCAILDFLDSEFTNGNPIPEEADTDIKPPVAVQPPKLIFIMDSAAPEVPKPAENATQLPQSTQGPEMCGVWDIKTGESVKPKGRKRALSPETRQRVAENRGNACAFHRKAKTQVS